MEHLVERIIKGDKRSVAKAITIIENNDFYERGKLINLLFPYTGKAKVIGITGPPGAGKSTLVDGLIEEIRKNNLTVGIIAVDPSSPFSGGAILGDRVRMQRHSIDPGVYIRSMGSRGALGGLARSTEDVVSILDAMGLDIIIIETIGVGQAELSIINISSTNIVVLNPNSGDNIQAFKAGIMEIADIFVVNKSDLPGAQKMVFEIENLVDISKQNKAWKPFVIKTIASEKTGIDNLWLKVMEHYNFTIENDILLSKRKEIVEEYLIATLNELFSNDIRTFFETKEYNHYKKLMINKQKSPFEIAEIIYNKTLNSGNKWFI